MSNDMLKNLPKDLVAAVKLIIETTVPVQTRSVQQLDEGLKGGQHKIDANKNGKIDAQDFKLLRRKKAVKEALESGVDVSDIVQFHSPMQSDLHGEIAVVVHRDARDGAIHVMSEGMKYKLKKGQVKEVSEELLDTGSTVLSEEEALSPVYNVKDKTGKVVGTHSANQGFRPTRPDSGLKAHPIRIPDGHSIDKTKPVNRSFGTSKLKEEIEEGMEFEFEDRGIATVVEITENRIVLAFDEGVEEFYIDDLDFNELDEAYNEYKAGSEKSKFNSGHRAKLLNPEGKLSYLSQKSYKTPAHAKAAAEFYSSIMHLSTGTMDSKMHNYNKSYDTKHGNVKEEVELDEARGRPPKAPKEGQKPSPAWQRHLERQSKGEDKEELEALGAQLRKAVSINKPVTFLNGEKKEINPSHISKFEDHMEARPKTIDKQKFQNDAHASHDDFVKAVTAPVPKPQGGTSSIVKYR